VGEGLAVGASSVVAGDDESGSADGSGLTGGRMGTVDEEDEDEEELVVLVGAEVELELELELVLVLVPSVVGSERVDSLAVSGMLMVGRSSVVVIPLADPKTVVARLLAVPHPNCEKPPSYTFL